MSQPQMSQPVMTTSRTGVSLSAAWPEVLLTLGLAAASGAGVYYLARKTPYKLTMALMVAGAWLAGGPGALVLGGVGAALEGK